MGFKVNELTEEQIAKFPEYVREGIEIGLATGAEFDEDEVRRITQRHRVNCGVPEATKFLVFDSPMAACRAIPGLSASNALYGQHDINWLQFDMFFRRECGLVEETEPMVLLYELAKRVGWMWMDGTTTVVTRRPIRMSFATKTSGLKVLHNPNGLALEYADGEGLYLLNGLLIPKEFEWIVTTPADELDPAKILKIKNTEVRSEAIKKVGMTTMLARLDSTTIHKYHCDVGGDYELHQINLNGFDRKYLKMVCPSKGETRVEAVPPTITTCQEALTWREWEAIKLPNGYQPPLVRT